MAIQEAMEAENPPAVPSYGYWSVAPTLDDSAVDVLANRMHELNRLVRIERIPWRCDS